MSEPIEQTHPSLKKAKLLVDGKYFTIKYKDGIEENVFRVREIQEHTIDKQVIRDLIYKIRPNSFSGRNWKMVLKKELGL